MRVLTDKKIGLMKSLISKANFNIPRTGDIIEAKVIAIKPQTIYLDLENFKTGVILGKEIKENPQQFKNLKPGDSISVKVTSLENEDGYVEASLLRAGEERKWRVLKEKMEKGEIIEAEVLKANKGGLMIEVNNIEAFMPVSQLSSTHYPRVEGGDKQKILQSLNQLIGKKIKLKIIDLDPREKKLIVSEKAAGEKRLKKALEKYKVGDVVEGEITGIVDFGVFVKFPARHSPDLPDLPSATRRRAGAKPMAGGGDLEGLIHISEIDWQIIDNPADFFKVGDKVKAKIVEIEDDKISLSTRALRENPWEKVRDKYQTGQLVKGIVTKFNPFGVFVQLDKKIQGLAHISEFGTEKNMKETLEIGKKYEFKILSIKPSEYRMALKPMISPSTKTTEDKDKKE